MLTEKMVKFLEAEMNAVGDLMDNARAYDNFDDPEDMDLAGKSFALVGLVALATDNPPEVEDRHIVQIIDSAIKNLEALKVKLKQQD